MKTNVKNPRNPPAIVLITPDDFSLNYYFQGKELTIDSSTFKTGFNNRVDSAGIETKATAVLNQIDQSPCRMIIILSAQLTLFSEQEFPADLPDAQIGELLMLQLSNRTESGEINTFYDYFLLKKTQSASTYGLVEARKDVLNAWMTIFEHHGFRTVAVVSQPIVFINNVMKNIEINSDQFQIVCLLRSRIFIAYINGNQVEKIVEHVTSADYFKIDSIASLIVNFLGEGVHESNYPTIILDTIDCGIVDQVVENFRIFPGFQRELVLGENTFKCLRADYDMYQSIALA